MAGIVSATAAQIQTARDAVRKLGIELQMLSQGPYPGVAGLGADLITRIDTAVDNAVAAIAPLNT